MDRTTAGLIAVLAACFAASLIGAILLRATARWVQKLDVGFGNAYFTLLLSNMLNTAMVMVACLIVRAATHSRKAIDLALVLLIPVGFLIQSAFVSSRLRVPFRRGCLLSLVMVGLLSGLGLVAAVVALVFDKLL